ncbi:MAG: hypothetical protein AVDCRST_MAG90-2342, partial [uncultured Microvirga sp.]
VEEPGREDQTDGQPAEHGSGVKLHGWGRSADRCGISQPGRRRNEGPAVGACRQRLVLEHCRDDLSCHSSESPGGTRSM